jgi:hypothetical protein
VKPRDEDNDILARGLAREQASGIDVIEPDEWDGETPPKVRHKVTRKKVSEFKPDLNPTQQESFDDPADIVCCVGPKGSGKTVGLAHKIVRHMYENPNALQLAISATQTTGKEGFGHELENMILPQWQEGMNLEFKPWKMDPVTKDRHMWIGNRFAGWSKLMLKSIPHCNMVEARVKGPAYSGAYVDELDVCGGIEYFEYTNAQLGRRAGILGPQQFTASLNPTDPAHWTYKFLYEDYVVTEGGRVWPNDTEKPGIMRDWSQSLYFVPFSENAHRLDPNYRVRLEKMFRSNPILYKRLIEGRWIAVPAGDAFFKLFYSEAVHVAGTTEPQVRGLKPITGKPIIIGYDLGKVNSGIIFMQCIETEFGPYWLVFDELCYYGERIPYQRVARALLEKMAYWNRRVGYRFQYRHLSDSSAFNQFQAAKGSVDAADILEYTTKIIKDNPDRFGELSPVRLVEVPKPPDSVKARAGLVVEVLMDRQMIVSAPCKWVRGMFMQLIRSKEDPSEPAGGKWRHTFDALSYPMFYRHLVMKNGFHESAAGQVEVSA